MQNIGSFIKTIKNVHDDHSILMESINKLNGDSLQNFQDAVMRYVNYYYGDFIEENLIRDPQFRHLFGNKSILVSGNPVSLGKKEHDYDFQKKTPKYKIATTTEPNKLLNKVEAKSKLIKKTSKTLFKNVAYVKDISGNNLGSFFLKKEPKLTKCIIDKNQTVHEKLSLIVPSQTKNIQFDKKDNSNQRIFFILNKSQIENSIIATNNLSDKDLHSGNFNENIQKNEIYFSNSDYNGENWDKNLSSTCGKLDNQKDMEKGQKNKMICKNKNKRKLGTENNKNFLRTNNKKRGSQTTFDIERYLRTEELKKSDRYKYNSGGHLKYCKNIIKKKCIYSFEGKEKNGLLQNIQFTDKKNIPLKLCKLNLKSDNILSDDEKILDSQNKVVVGSPINNSLENKKSLRGDCNTNGIPEFGKSLSSEKIEEDNVECSVDIQNPNIAISNINYCENEGIQNSKPYRQEIIVDSEKNNSVDSIHISHSKLDLDKIEFPSQKNAISLKNDQVLDNNAIKIKYGSGNGIEAISKEDKENVEIYGRYLKKVIVHEKQNVSDKHIHCNWNFHEIRSGNLAEHIRDRNFEKFVNPGVGVSSEAMNHNMKHSNKINSKTFSNFDDNTEYNKDEINFQGSNKNSVSCSDEHNSYVCPIKKYSSESDATDLIIQLEDKLETCKYSSLGVADEKTNKFNVITVTKKNSNESKTDFEAISGTSINSNINLEFNNEQFNNIQQNVDSVKKRITDKIEKISSIKLKKETHFEKPENKIFLDSLKTTDLGNTIKTNKDNEIPLNEITVRRSSLRNKTGALIKTDVENHMLVKITYNKGNVRKNNLWQEQNVFNSKVNERSSRNADTKENKDNSQKKNNFCYNLRSSITRQSE